MATVKDVISLMEEIAPLKLSDIYCEKYGGCDNSGLLLGDYNKQVFSVLVSLDITSEVAAEAEDIAADMIICHHPLIFNGIKSITKNDPLGKILYRLIKNDIAVYAAHLNFDIAPFGVNRIMADRLELTDCVVMQPTGEETGLGRIGKLPQSLPLKEVARMLEEITGKDNIKVCGEGETVISAVAVVCGAGGDETLLKAAYEGGADLFITSEIKHHIALNATERGIAMIDGGHHATEQIAIPVLAKLLAGYAEKRDIDIEVTESGVNTDPFK